MEARTATPYRDLAHQKQHMGASSYSYVRTVPTLVSASRPRTVCTNRSLSADARVVHILSDRERSTSGHSSRPRDKKPSSRPNAQAPQCSVLPAYCVPDLELAVYLHVGRETKVAGQLRQPAASS